MGKKSIAIVAGLAALTIVSIISSCEKYTLPAVSLEKDTLFVPFAGGVYNLCLNCNVAWSISNPNAAQWSAIEPVSGHGDDNFTISVDLYEGDAPRAVQYVVQTEAIEKKLTVIQQPE